MLIDCVLTSCNMKERYLDFIPLFIKTWKKLYPISDIKIILINNYIPEHLNNFKEYIILYPVDDKQISSIFVSQYIRLLYPCILNYENGILITDIDDIPMNSAYFGKNIKNFDNNSFIYYRNWQKKIEYAMCWNIACNFVWKEIFNIYSLNDISERLISVFKDKSFSGWSQDQLDLYKHITNYYNNSNNSNNFIMLKDRDTGFNRLDRFFFPQQSSPRGWISYTDHNYLSLELPVLSNNFRQNIKDGIYSDYHCLRPFKHFEKINEEIYNLLPKNIPIVIICFNNYKYVINTIKQINSINHYYDNFIIILNNNSNDKETINYLNSIRYKYRIINNKSNSGPWISKEKNKHIYDILPSKFILTDPDLEFNINLPSNFIDILDNLSEKYKCEKIGFALDISDYKNFIPGNYVGQKSIFDWEKQFWTNQIKDNDYELYNAPIDTTFSLINKNNFIGNWKIQNNNTKGIHIRIAGNFTAKHIPWYINNNIYPLSKIDKNMYPNNAISTISKLINRYKTNKLSQ